MSEFSRGVFGVFALGLIAGFGALMLVPQSSPQATTRLPDPPAQACGQQAGPNKDANCPKATVARRAEAHSIAALRRNLATQGSAEAPQPDLQAAAEPLPVLTPEPAAVTAPATGRTAAPAKRSADGTRVAQRRKPSRQDAYYNGSRNHGGGFAMGNGFFPLFR
jgi:hypothetical protein